MKEIETWGEWRKKAEIAERLRCTTRTVDTYMAHGMPCFRLTSRKVLFRDADVDAWVAKHRVGGAR